ncbi:MAG: hypothetical protein Tsb006_6840 [Rickettsiaceae bacterium]
MCELVSILAKNKIPENEIDNIIDDIVPGIIPFSEDIGIKAGKVTKLTANHGLSLGDRACLATALHLGLPVYTADKVWAELNIPNMEIHIIK